MEEFTEIAGTVSTCSELQVGQWFSIDTYLRTDNANHNEDVQALYMMRPIANVDFFYLTSYYTDGLFPRVLMDSNEFSEDGVKNKWTIMLSFQSYQLGAHFRLLTATDTAEEGFRYCAELNRDFESCVNLHDVLRKCEELDVLPLTIKLQY